LTFRECFVNAPLVFVLITDRTFTITRTRTHNRVLMARSHTHARACFAQMVLLNAQLANFQFRDRSWKAVQEIARIMFGIAAVRMARAGAAGDSAAVGALKIVFTQWCVKGAARVHVHVHPENNSLGTQ
jgi:hypothetical protein